MEVWRSIAGFEHYQVSSAGRVKSLKRRIEVVLKPSISNSYQFVGLWIGNKFHPKKIHSLVAATFLPRPPSAQCINHKDGNKLNNDVSNLEWATFKENANHARALGLTKVWPPPVHGRYSTFSNHKCKCDPCRKAWNLYCYNRRHML